MKKILGTGVPHPYLLSPQGRSLERDRRMALIRSPDGTLELDRLDWILERAGCLSCVRAADAPRLLSAPPQV
jgi:hypothetical protein